MRVVAAGALCIALFAGPGRADGRHSWQDYQQRRLDLARAHPGGVIVLLGYGEGVVQTSRSAFRQENNFYYLSGWNEPGAALVLLPPEGDNPAHREVLFIPRGDALQERWTGPRIAPATPTPESNTGFAVLKPVSELASFLRREMRPHQRLYSLLPREPVYGQHPDPDRRERLRELVPDRRPEDIRPALERMRRIKSESEIAWIQKAVDASIDAHLKAWSNTRAGLYEYQIMAAMLGVLFDRGCPRPAYAPTIGGGPNAAILHYTRNQRRLREHELLLIDVGGEYGHYAADLTRTIPVSGSFAARQRKLYDLVEGAQRAVLASVKPGMTLSGEGPASLTRIAKNYFDAEGQRVLGEKMSSFFIHGLGHHVGLEVHDPVSPSLPLQPGMVITIEPGLYLPEENLGIRIEDMVLVTAGGSRLMSRRLPREAAAIERFLTRAE